MTLRNNQGRPWVWASIDEWHPGDLAALKTDLGPERSGPGVVVGGQPEAAAA